MKVLRYGVLGLGVVFVIVFFWLRWCLDHEPALARPLEGPASDKAAQFELGYAPQLLRRDPGELSFLAHPFMAGYGRSAMHSDAGSSDVHPAAAISKGPVKMLTRRAGGKLARQCATFTFLKNGYPVALCGGLTSFRLSLFDPEDLTLLAKFDLPMRPSAFEALVKRDRNIIFADTSGGAYFYLDEKERVVVADSRQHIRRIALIEHDNGTWKFEEEDSWDMSAHVPHDCFHYNNLFPNGECDGITTVMPDFEGQLWWVTRLGRIGTLDPETGNVEKIHLQAEEIQNSFVVDKDAVYILSDHALYAYRADNAGRPVELWRHAYDRGTKRKIGSINQGSGTTPTLLGEAYLTFADNADGRINLVVVRRGAVREGQSREICKVPVFEDGGSATDNSMIGFGRTIILENNSGYQNADTQKDWEAVVPGVVRLDIREDETGCEIIWQAKLRVPSVVPKLSLGNGIAYFYSYDNVPGGTQLWYLVGLDFETGKEVVRIPTGYGTDFNNNWASIAIAPDGDIYVGTRKGFVQLSGGN